MRKSIKEEFRSVAIDAIEDIRVQRQPHHRPAHLVRHVTAVTTVTAVTAVTAVTTRTTVTTDQALSST